MRIPIRYVVFAPLLGVALACGETTGLLSASTDNVVDTVSLYALSRTPISSPSAYKIEALRSPPSVVRTDQNAAFDFAFDIDTLDRAVLLPTGALHLGRASGAQVVGESFDSLKIAPNSGYQLDSAVVVDNDVVVALHSRPSDCGIALTAVYHFFAKLRVIRIDPTARRIDFEILVDQNCGYRGLELGRPRR